MSVNSYLCIACAQILFQSSWLRGYGTVVLHNQGRCSAALRVLFLKVPWVPVVPVGYSHVL